MRITTNKPSGWQQDPLKVPIYMSLGLTFFFLLSAFGATGIGTQLPRGTAGFMLALPFAAAGGVLVIQGWRTRQPAIRTALFILILPLLAVIGVRIKFAVADHEYGLEVFAIIIFLLAAPFFIPKSRLYSHTYLLCALAAYCFFSFFSAIATHYDVFHALDSWLLVVLIPCMAFALMFRVSVTSVSIWWIVLGLVWTVATANSIGIMTSAASATWGGYDASQLFAAETISVRGVGATRYLIGGIYGSGMVLQKLNCIVIPLALGLVFRHRVAKSLRWCMITSLIVMTYPVIIGQSRSVLLGLVGGITVVIAMLPDIKKQVVWCVCALFIAALSWNAISDYLARRPLRDESSGDLIDAGRVGEYNAYGIAWKMFKSNPILGVGLGRQNFSSASTKHGRAIAHAHNMVLQVLADRGLLGAVPFLLLVISSLARAFQQARRAQNYNDRVLWASICGAVVGFIVYSQFEPFFGMGREAWQQIVVWSLLALAWSAETPQRLRAYRSSYHE